MTLQELIIDLVRLQNYCNGRFPGRQIQCLMQIEGDAPVRAPIDKARVQPGNPPTVILFSPHARPDKEGDG